MEAAVDEVSGTKWRGYMHLLTSLQSMETKYTKIETSVPIIPHTIKGYLTPALCKYTSL